MPLTPLAVPAFPKRLHGSTAGAHIAEIRELCRVALSEIKASVSEMRNDLPVKTWAEARAELDAVPPGVLADYEQQRPGFLLMYWLHVAYCEAGKEASDAHFDDLLAKYCQFLAVENTTPN